ncbi:replication protein [Fodinibius halophilus]|uniref:Replication protein n=1 Tax=Fodinibius halophilus TaxID=1736908 RepID=A0A6M1TFW8_9BACT|nr:replication protein [Fodinibius halophilus]NGP89694.1 replication protein [Fodinibius halophilus]
MPRLPDHVSFTMIPNFIFDEQLESLSGGELKILLMIYRKTVGFDKKSDKISYSQLVEFTGLSKSTISQGIKGLVHKKLVKIDRTENTNRYTYCLPDINISGSSKIEPEVVQKSNTQPVRKSNTQKKVPKETEKNTTSSSNLSEDLWEVINYWNTIFPNTLNPDDPSKVKDIEEALDQFTVKQIKQAIFMRSKCSYYRDNKPQLLNKPSAFFPYPETIANDLERKSRDMYDFQEMINKVTSSNLTTDDFEQLADSEIWVLKKQRHRMLIKT